MTAGRFERMLYGMASDQLERAAALRDPETCQACAGTGELKFTESGPWGDIKIKTECPDCTKGDR